MDCPNLIVTLDQVSVRYGSQLSLDQVNLTVSSGEFVLVTGPSGCGKSTLTRCLNGLIPHTVRAELTGVVKIEGRATTARSVADLATSVGLVFQNPATQLFSLTVREEAEFGPRNLGLSESEVAGRAAWALRATGMEPLGDRAVRTLSSGEQQRLAIAGVLAMRPRLLVLDEPTSSLDVRGRLELMAALGQLHAEHGMTVIVVEHRLGEVARLAARTLVMDAGRVMADGPTEAIFGQRELLRRLGLRRPAEVAQGDWPALLTPCEPPPGEPIVELHGVEAGYGNRAILRDLDLTLYEGEFVALVGDNAAGKSTLARLLVGLVKPRRGRIRWRRHGWLPGRDVGLMFQNPLSQLFCSTVAEEVSFGPLNFGCFDASQLESVLQATDLGRMRDRPIHGLSSGQQQRTALAAVLALRPRFVILDEPTMGQDWRHLSMFMDYLVALNASGCTILLVSHDYKLVHHYAHRVLLLRDGHIVADGAPAEPRRHSELRDQHAVHHS